MKFSSSVQTLAPTECLTDIDRNSVFRFTPSPLTNNVYRSNHSIKFVEQGFEEYEIDGGYQKLGSGETMLVNSERNVSARTCGKAIAIFLEDELIQDIFCDLSGAPQLLDEVINSHNNRKVFRSDFNQIWCQLLASEIELTEEFYYEVGSVYLTMVFSNSNRTSVGLKNEVALSDAIRKIEVARTFIHDHIEQQISLEVISKEAGMSKFYLLRSFKALYGFSPLKLHTFLRLNRAKELLKQGHYNLTQIANQLDYPDLPTFSKQFKKAFGQAPSTFVS